MGRGRRKGTLPNAEVARLLREIGDRLELDHANPFRIRAYRNAARTVDRLTEPIAAADRGPDGSLEDLPGIGADLAGTIRALASMGTVPLLDELRKKISAGELELLQVRGLGPKRIQALKDALGVRSAADLRRALEREEVREIRGFGPRSEAKLLAELAARPTGAPRMLRATAAQYGEALAERLRAVAGVDQVEIAGSFRRGRETVGDLDLLAVSSAPEAVIEALVTAPEATAVLQRGEAGASVRIGPDFQVDLRVVPARSFGAALYYFTGSKAHNIAVRRLAQQRGLKINEYGVFRGRKRVGGRTEREVARAVGLPWIPPELREDRGEIGAARSGELPELVTLDDLQGDLQMHTTDSDGRDDLDTMVRAAAALGHRYVAVSDHSPAVRVTRGLDPAGFRAQGSAIDRLNRRRRGLEILKSVEVDILADGALDLDDRTLGRFDLVTAAVHSRFELPADVQTRRIVRAVEHPAVHVLAHPTGRLIGERAGMAADWDQIFRAAADQGVWLEVNAQPSRLDLDDLACRRAVELGVTLTISSDAHSAAELDFLRWGVTQARRGWVTARSVANTWRLATLRGRLRHAGRKRR